MSLLEAVLRLGFLAALFAAAMYMLRRYGQRRGPVRNRLQVTARVGVGRHSSVLVVQHGDRAFLVGAAPNGITLLSEVDPDSLPDVDAMAAGDGADPSDGTPARKTSTTFAELLSAARAAVGR